MKEVGVWGCRFGGSEKAGRRTLFRRKKCAQILSLKPHWVPLPAEHIFALRPPHIRETYVPRGEEVSGASVQYLHSVPALSRFGQHLDRVYGLHRCCRVQI